jgi:hypothetical protein
VRNADGRLKTSPHASTDLARISALLIVFVNGSGIFRPVSLGAHGIVAPKTLLPMIIFGSGENGGCRSGTRR